MTLKINDAYIKDFIKESEYAEIQPEITAAHKTLLEKTGEGSFVLYFILDIFALSTTVLKLT